MPKADSMPAAPGQPIGKPRPMRDGDFRGVRRSHPAEAHPRPLYLARAQLLSHEFRGDRCGAQPHVHGDYRKKVSEE